MHRLAYQLNFTTLDNIRSDLRAVEAGDFHLGPNCWDQSLELSANGYTIYAFKITPGPIWSVRSPARSFALQSSRLEIKFSAQTNVNIRVAKLSQHRGQIEIDKYE